MRRNILLMYKNKKILVVIPARSLSKGIKNKNIIKLNGKPLFAHSINYAKKSKIVDKIIVICSPILQRSSIIFLNLFSQYNRI